MTNELIINSYITARYFRINYSKEYSYIKKICSSVSQDILMGHLFRLIKTNIIRQSDGVDTATISDNTALFAIGQIFQSNADKLQTTVNNFTEK